MRLLILLASLASVQACKQIEGRYACTKESYGNTGAGRQSPIDLPDSSLTATNGDPFPGTAPLSYFGYDTPVTLKLGIKGSTVQASASSGVLNAGINVNGVVYNAAQFHLHWGTTSAEGSEHTVVGRKFPAELHIVHLRSDLPSVAAALAEAPGRRDGLAVLGVLFEEDETDANGAALKTLEDAYVDFLIADSSSTPDITLNLADLLPINRYSQWRYEGSLTTPDFAEIVQWQVLRGYSTITSRQLSFLRSISPAPFRTVQDLAGRPVYCS